MFEHVCANDAVVAIRAKECAEVVPVKVGNDDIAIPSAGDVCLFRVEGHAIGHDRLVLAKVRTQTTRTHAQIKEGLPGLDQLGNNRQRVLPVADYRSLVHMKCCV